MTAFFDIDRIGQSGTKRAVVPALPERRQSDEMLITDAPRSAAVRTAFAMYVDAHQIPVLTGRRPKATLLLTGECRSCDIGATANTLCAPAGRDDSGPPACRAHRNPRCRPRYIVTAGNHLGQPSMAQLVRR